MYNPEDYTFYNYNNELVCYYTHEGGICETNIKYHSLIYLSSGTLNLKINNKEIVFFPGQTVFLQRNHFLFKKKSLYKGLPFRAIAVNFTPSTLRKLYRELQFKVAELPKDLKLLEDLYYIIPPNSFTNNLFESLDNFIKNNINPSKEMMYLKLKEILLYIIEIQPSLIYKFFNISDPWKIDLEVFMNENFRHDFSLNDFSHFTGRSLSTFKKDFKDIYGITPGKWIIKRRLEEARTLLRKEKVSNVYLEVGFKNISHFSKAFKKEFGISPSQIIDEDNSFLEKQI